VQIIFIWLYIGGLYFDNFHGTYLTNNDWQSLVGFMFFISMDSLMQAMVPITLTFARERENFLKEENSKLYSTTAYFISRNVTELPYAIIFPIIQLGIGYWMVGLTVTV
jgi:ATP-binding cassette, subfamily G (WHITE), eye pigment precursor transporter